MKLDYHGDSGIWNRVEMCEGILSAVAMFHQLHAGPVSGLPTIRSESVEREVQGQEFGSLYAAASNG